MHAFQQVFVSSCGLILNQVLLLVFPILFWALRLGFLFHWVGFYLQAWASPSLLLILLSHICSAFPFLLTLQTLAPCPRLSLGGRQGGNLCWASAWDGAGPLSVSLYCLILPIVYNYLLVRCLSFGHLALRVGLVSAFLASSICIYLLIFTNKGLKELLVSENPP